MPSAFETSDAHASFHLKPLRVPILADAVFEEARDLATDLSGWTLVEADAVRRRIVCRRAKGLFRGESTVTITLDGPVGVPSTTVNVRSETRAGLLSRDRRIVLEFMVPFHRRVC